MASVTTYLTMTRMEFIEKAIDIGSKKSVFPIDKKSARNFCYLIFHMLDDMMRHEGEKVVLAMIKYSNASFKEDRSFTWKEYDGKNRQKPPMITSNKSTKEETVNYTDILDSLF